jgi:hypothetical protein
MVAKSPPRRRSRPPVAGEHRVEIGVGLAALVFGALAVLYFLPAFLPGRNIFGTDYLAGGYFFYDFVSQRLAAWELPKWVPYVYGGLPLYSNPGSTFYPVRLVADILFPVTWILPFIFVVQFAVAGVGMYLLVRELGCRTWVAFVSGLAFQFTGITLSSVYAGHDGRVIVATFAPLFLFFLHRGIRTGSFAAFAGAAGTLGFSLLSFQIQSNYYLLLAGGIWAVFVLIHLEVHRNRRVLARRVAMGGAAVAFGFTLAAVNFVPFLDYVPESPRGAEGGRGYEYAIGFSMAPVELLAIAVPEHAGILDHYVGANPFKLHTEYVGALVVVLLVLGFRYSRRNRYWWFFGGLGLFVLTIAFGGHTPIYRLYYELLPGTARFRAPAISFFLVALCLVAMAGITLERLLLVREKGVEGSGGRRVVSPPGDGPQRWLIGIAIAAVTGVVVAASTASGTARGDAMVAGFGRFALFAGLVCGAIWLWWADRLRTVALVAVLSVVTVVDLWVVGRDFFETVPGPDVTFAPDDVVRFLADQPQPERVWVLPFPAGAVYRGHGNYLMLYGIEQASGEHGNHLQRYGEYAGAGEEVYIDYANYLDHPNFLHAANIRHVIAMVELPFPFLREVHRGSALIYENTAALPRAYLVGEVVTSTDTTAALDLLADPEFDVARTAVVYGSDLPSLPGGPLEGGATITEATPDRLVVRAEASRPALLVLADNYLHGWRARVNGEDRPIHMANHTFRGVYVDAGTSEVVFEYRPTELYVGFYIYLVALLALTGYAIRLLVTRRRRTGEISA